MTERRPLVLVGGAVSELPVGDTLPGGGSGDVVGPASATDNAVARFNGTGGKDIQNSRTTIDDDGKVVIDGTVGSGQYLTTFSIDGVVSARIRHNRIWELGGGVTLGGGDIVGWLSGNCAINYYGLDALYAGSNGVRFGVNLDTPDTGITRSAAGVLLVGNGTAGNTSGELRATIFRAGTSGAYFRPAANNALHGMLVADNGGYGIGYYGFAHFNINAASGAGLGFSSGVGGDWTAPDTAIHRLSAGELSIGGNTAGSFSGGLRLTTLRFADGTSMTTAPGAGGVSDGDKGDITVSSSGTVWTIDNGAVSLAKMADVATGTLFYRKTAGTGAPEVQTLATLKTDLGLTGTNSGDQTITLTGDVTGSGTGSFSATIASDAVTNAKLADVASATIKGRTTAGTGDPEDLTGTQATALLDTFTSAAKGLAPASGGGTTNFLRADGTWASPPGGAPGGSSGEVQFNNGGAFAGAVNVEVDGGNLKLVSTSDPAAPTGGILLYSSSFAGRHLPKIIGPSGINTALQVGLHGNSVLMVGPSSSTAAPTIWGGTLTTIGTLSSQQTIASANPWQATQRKRAQTAATAGTTGGFRVAYTQWFRGNAAGFGGFFFRAQFGQNLNVNGAQCFVGLCASTAALASTAGAVGALINMIGVGYDTTDASTGNWFLYRNDGSGTATKVDLGATNAARNTTHGYDLIVFCPPGAATEIFVRIVNLHTGATVLDTSYTTDIPAVNTGLAWKAEVNNGAVASAVNIEIAKIYVESDY